MSKNLIKFPEIKVLGESWVIELPDDFSRENNLKKGTQVLLTFRENDRLEAEIVQPLSRSLETVSKSILKRRRGAFEELKRIGD